MRVVSGRRNTSRVFPAPTCGELIFTRRIASLCRSSRGRSTKREPSRSSANGAPRSSRSGGGQCADLQSAPRMRDFLLVHINGVPHRIGASHAFETLSRFLRDDQRATGTKIVCEEGDCGACTVLVGRRENGALRYRPINSCIQFLFQLDCTHIVTVEGLARGGDLTPVQDAMVRCHGAQCGYCTPGFIMAMAGMYEDTPQPTAHDVRAALTGNLCRCTGYEPIVKAGIEAASQPKIDQLYPGGPILEEIRAHERGPVRIGHFFKPADLESAI